MTFTPKDWKDSPDTSTPLTAAALEDLETRLATYTDAVGAGGVELGYAQTTSNFVTTSTVLTDVTSLSTTVTVGSRPIVVIFYADGANTTAAFGFTAMLNMDGSSIGAIGGGLYNSSSAIVTTINARRRLTPSAGSHTFKIQVKNNSAGTLTLTAGAGTSTNNAPMFIQVLGI